MQSSGKSGGGGGGGAAPAGGGGGRRGAVESVGAGVTCPGRNNLAVGGFTGYRRVPTELVPLYPPPHNPPPDRVTLAAATRAALAEPATEFAPMPDDQTRVSVRVAVARPMAGTLPMRPKG